jgi:hypothetical protein
MEFTTSSCPPSTSTSTTTSPKPDNTWDVDIWERNKTSKLPNKLVIFEGVLTSDYSEEHRRTAWGVHKAVSGVVRPQDVERQGMGGLGETLEGVHGHPLLYAYGKASLTNLYLVKTREICVEILLSF